VLAGGEQNPPLGAPVAEIHDRRSMQAHKLIGVRFRFQSSDAFPYQMILAAGVQAGVIVGRFDPLDIVRERDDGAAGTLTAFSRRGQIAIGRCQSQPADAAGYFGVARKA
jgi:hypothetical protein